MSDPIHQLIANPLRVSQGMMNKHLEGLSPEQYLHRAVPGSNCTAWLLGHLILTDRSALTGLKPDASLPELPAGFEARFSREPGAPAASDFGDVTLLAPLFNQSRDALIAAVEQASVDTLQAPLEKPHPRFKTAAEKMQLMGLHVVLHIGQISTIRRSLGMPPLN